MLFTTQVTQSTVDKYVDDILLQTIYSSAHEDTLLELGVDPEQVSAEEETGAGRRQSTGDTGAEVRSKESRMVRQRMRTTQKKYLSAAHDHIWGMLDQFKQAGEVMMIIQGKS